MRLEELYYTMLQHSHVTSGHFGYRLPHGKSVDSKWPPGQNKKIPTMWVRPPSQRGEDERRIGWKKNNVVVI